MYFKLALNNIKKSYKDYLIYFLTISFGICLFYLFNSMESQKAMLVINKGMYESLKMMSKALEYVSFFMSIVLAFLMVYANQFLIRRRKKELGVYMTLGMDRLKISYVLVLETLLIGIISLIVGLLLGIAGSHVLSIVTARMFMVDMKPFRFIFSATGFLKSLVNFGIIYFVVIVLNVFNISRVKLIDLLYAKRKSQNIKIRNPFLSVFMFILSIMALLYAYHCIKKNGMMTIDAYFNQSILFGLIGTFLFFMSLSGIMLQIIQKNHKIYYKNLNMFSLRQINSKVNSTHIMLSIICILLLIAIGTFSTGMGIASVVNDSQELTLPFDLSLSIYQYEEPFDLFENVPYVQTLSGLHAQTNIYTTEMLLGDFVDVTEYKGALNSELLRSYTIEFMKVSELNDLLILQGKDPVVLSEDAYLLMTNRDDMYAFYKSIDKSGIQVKDRNLKFEGVFKGSYKNEYMATNIGIVIVSDGLVDGMELQETATAFNLINENVYEVDSKLKNEELRGRYLSIDTRQVLLDESLGLKVIVAYIALYVGFVFIMSSVVCLALQQLTEASDNVERYALLRKLGVEKKLINHALLVQISVYFILPLGLAIIHSIIGLQVASNVVKAFGDLNIIKNMFITSGFVILIYGSYYIVTYVAASSIVTKKQ